MANKYSLVPFLALLLIIIANLGPVIEVIRAEIAGTVKLSRKPSRLLEGADFRLDTRILAMRGNSSKVDGEIELSEYYSNVQQRAKLEFHRKVRSNHNERLEYYYDNLNGKRMVKINPATNGGSECKLADAETLAADLFGSLATLDRDLTGKDWLQGREDDGIPDYIVGAARLLLIFESNRDKVTSVLGQGSTIRNHEVVKYEMRIDLSDRLKGLTLVAYYGKTSIHWLKYDLPLRIWTILPNMAELVIDYAFIEPIVELKTVTGKQDESVDLFSLQPAIGCFAHLKPTSMLSEGFWAPRVVSFRAQVSKDWLGDKMRSLSHHFVAYDGLVKASRFDTIKEAQTETNEADQYSITILDLARDRKYNIRQELLRRSQTGATGSGGIHVDHAPPSQCVASKIIADDGVRSGSLSPYEPLIPFYSLVQLGLAKVRGIETEVFEMDDTKLPDLFFPRLGVRDPEGQSEQFHFESSQGEIQNYTLVYYFSRLAPTDETILTVDGRKLGPLLRVDIVVKRKGNLPRLSHRIDVFDFVWMLADAPNGDRQTQLFSLADRCVWSGSHGEQYALMSMDLEYDNEIAGRKRNASELFKLIENPVQRNKALVRAVCESSTKLTITQIESIESRVIFEEAEEVSSSSSASLILPRTPLQIRLVIRLMNNQASDQLYEANKIGDGFLTEATWSLPASNMEECFWESAHLHNSNLNQDKLIFSYCLGVCFIESVYENESEAFVDSTSDKRMPAICQIMRLDRANTIPSSAPGQRDIWYSIYNSLRSSIVHLPVTQAGDRSDPFKNVKLWVKRLELGNNKWMALRGTTNSESSLDFDNSLKGLGLVPGEDSTKGKLIKTSAQDRDTASMSYSLCHSNCMAEMSCRSFSICVDNQDMECLISEINFKNESLIKEIKRQTKSLKQRAKHGKVSLMLGDQSEDNLELRVDARCRIYNKYAIEMFKEMTTTFTILQPDDKETTIAMDNEEQCAELCLDWNVKFLRMIHESKDGGDSKVTGWCTSFKFINLASLRDARKAALRGGIEPAMLNGGNGLCKLPPQLRSAYATNGSDPEIANKEEQSNEMKIIDARIESKMFTLVATLMFEQHRGVRLLETKENAIDSSARLINNQLVFDRRNAEHCALACFQQSSGLRPWCKSFDLIEERKDQMSGQGDKIVQITRFYCIFNSLTLAETRLASPQLISKETNANFKSIHYEPKGAFVGKLKSQLEQGVQELASVDDEEDSTKQAQGMQANLWLVVLLSLFTGLLIGSFAFKQALNRNRDRSESVSNHVRSFLNNLNSRQVEGLRNQSLDLDVNLSDLALQ